MPVPGPILDWVHVTYNEAKRASKQIEARLITQSFKDGCRYGSRSAGGQQRSAMRRRNRVEQREMDMLARQRAAQQQEQEQYLLQLQTLHAAALRQVQQAQVGWSMGSESFGKACLIYSVPKLLHKRACCSADRFMCRS